MQFTRYDEFALKVWKKEVDIESDRFDIALVNNPSNSGFSDISLQKSAANLAAFTGGSGSATGFDASNGGHEFDGSAYSRGTLAGQSLAIVSNEIIFDATDQTFSSLDDDGSAYGVGGILVIFYVDGTEANDVPAVLLPFEKTPSGSDVVCKWPSTGLFYQRQGA